MLEKDFTEAIIVESSRLCCSAAVRRMEIERLVRGVSEIRCSLLRLFAHEDLSKCNTWLNKYLTFHKAQCGPLKMREMYRFYVTVLFSHYTGFSLSKTVQILLSSYLKCDELSFIRFISSNILEFSATGRGDLGTASWNAQIDKTAFLAQFEKVAFQVSAKVFCPRSTLFPG